MRLKDLNKRISKSPLAQRLVNGALWSLSGAVFAKGLGLISSIIVARMLGKAGFGELGIIQSTIAMFGTFAGFGLGMTAAKFIAQYRSTDPIKAGRILALSSLFALIISGIISLAFYYSAPWLASNTLNAPQLADILKISALILFLSSINGAQTGALSGFEAFKIVAKINLVCGLINFPLMVGGAYLKGLEGVVWGMTIAVAINWLINHYAIRKECKKSGIPYTYRGCFTEHPVLWQFALPSMVSSIFFIPVEWALNALIVNQPGGYEQMGLFNAAKQWHVIILYIPSAISNMTLPIMSNLLGEGKYQQYKKMLLVNSFMLAGIALVVSLPIVIFSSEIMALYGPGFSTGTDILLLICFYSVLWAANIVIGQVLWTTGSTMLAMLLAALRALLLLGCFFYLVPHNALGLALAYSATYLLQTIYQSIISAINVKKYLKINQSKNSLNLI